MYFTSTFPFPFNPQDGSVHLKKEKDNKNTFYLLQDYFCKRSNTTMKKFSFISILIQNFKCTEVQISIYNNATYFIRLSCVSYSNS